MGWVIVALVMIYLVGLRIVARRYYFRRHHLTIKQGDSGSMTAALIGAAWPIAIWIPTVRNPEQCNHTTHILESARLEENARRAHELRHGRSA